MDKLTEQILIKNEIIKVSKRIGVEEIMIPIPQSSTGKAIAIGVLLAYTIGSAIYQSKEEKKRKYPKCSKLAGKEKKKCYLEGEISAIEKAISTLRQYRNKCKITNNPEKCYKAIDNTIEEYELRISQKKKRIQKIGK